MRCGNRALWELPTRTLNLMMRCAARNRVSRFCGWETRPVEGTMLGLRRFWHTISKHVVAIVGVHNESEVYVGRWFSVWSFILSLALWIGKDVQVLENCVSHLLWIMIMLNIPYLLNYYYVKDFIWNMYFLILKTNYEYIITKNVYRGIYFIKD